MKARRRLTLSQGQRFGRLVITGFDSFRKGKRYWACKCDCGALGAFLGVRLHNGDTQSCGCLQRERTSKAKRTHGESYGCITPEYKTWLRIWSRCTNPKVWNYRNYGGRGIKVCERWRKYENFLEDVGRRPAPKMTIERIKNDGNYEPGNCKWATCREQSLNRRSNVLLAFNDRTMPAELWAHEIGISANTLRARIEDGWSHERALTTPVRKQKNNVSAALLQGL